MCTLVNGIAYISEMIIDNNLMILIRAIRQSNFQTLS
jgi:hypothetical protein